MEIDVKEYWLSIHQSHGRKYNLADKIRSFRKTQSRRYLMKSRLTISVLLSVTFVTLLATFFWLTNKSEARTGESQEIQQPAANTLLSRFISLSVSAAKPYANADFDNLGSPQRFRYMSFPGSGYSALLTDFTLPPDYAAGTDVRVRFMVNSVGDCFVVLGADSVYESPTVSAGAYIQFPDGDPPDFNPQWTAHSDELRPFSVSIQVCAATPSQASSTTLARACS